MGVLSTSGYESEGTTIRLTACRGDGHKKSEPFIEMADTYIFPSHVLEQMQQSGLSDNPITKLGQVPLLLPEGCCI